MQISHHICPFCDYHFRMTAINRINLIADEETFKPLFNDIESLNPLNMEGYEEKLDIEKSYSKIE